MSRYTDADALLDTVFEVHCKECDKRKGKKNGKYKTIYEVGEAPCKSCGVNDMREYLEDAPSADVAPVVHGEWRANKDGSFSCSECKFKFYPLRFEYCPHCGAKMDADVIRHLEFLDKLKHCGTDMRGGTNEQMQ